jgi:hypothetical protein
MTRTDQHQLLDIPAGRKEEHSLWAGKMKDVKRLCFKPFLPVTPTIKSCLPNLRNFVTVAKPDKTGI